MDKENRDNKIILRVIVIGLSLLVVGAGVWALVFVKQRGDKQLADYYKAKTASQFDEYFNKYKNWLRKPPSEKESVSELFGQVSRSGTDVQKQQEHRLKADIESLALGEKEVLPYADYLYGNRWREKVKQYGRVKELREIASISGMVLAVAGGVLVSVGLIVILGRLLSHIFRRMGSFVLNFYEVLRADSEKQSLVEVDDADSDDGESEEIEAERDDKLREKLEKRRNKTLWKSGWSEVKLTAGREAGDESEEDEVLEGNGEGVSTSEKSFAGAGKEPEEDDGNNKFESFERNGLQEELSGSEKHLNFPSGDKSLDLPAGGKGNDAEYSNGQGETKLWQEQRSFEGGESLGQEQSATAIKEREEERGPITDTLKDLTAQVSAIREYASSQQEKVKKLQDGYDWTIIRSFCLRVIRCIDNLQSRIDALSEKEEDTQNLEEVRDELIFALESSGVEQFFPKLKSEYRGQEKEAEALKGKIKTDAAEMDGKIAEVARPGYRYFVDEKNCRIVRAAQVRLFEFVKDEDKNEV